MIIPSKQSESSFWKYNFLLNATWKSDFLLQAAWKYDFLLKATSKMRFSSQGKLEIWIYLKMQLSSQSRHRKYDFHKSNQKIFKSTWKYVFLFIVHGMKHLNRYHHINLSMCNRPINIKLYIQKVRKWLLLKGKYGQERTASLALATT